MVYDLGLGRHRRYIGPRDYRNFRKYQYGQWVQFIWTIATTQISLCLSLLRLNISRKLRPSLHCMISMILISNLVLALLWIFQCTPIRMAWISAQQGRCFSDDRILGITLAQGIISIGADVILALSPIAIIHCFHVNFRCKIALSILSSLGFFTTACSIVRTIYSWEMVAADETWLVATHIWRSAEANLGVVVACIPMLPLLCRYLIGGDPPSRRGSINRQPSTPQARSQRPSKSSTVRPSVPASPRCADTPPPNPSDLPLPEYRIPIKKTSEDKMTMNTGDTVVNDDFNGGSLQDISWLNVPPNQPEWSKAWLATDSNASTT